MRAALLTEAGKPLQVVDGLDPPPLRAGQVLVKIFYSGVCHSQLLETRGKRGIDEYVPHLLGHEGSGVIEAIGKGVTKFVPGDQVVLGWIKGKGIDAGGSVYSLGGKCINAGPVTTFNEYGVISENRCVKIPFGISPDIAVLLGCAVPTGAGIVINSIKPCRGSTIAIFGLGGVGLSALMATQLFHCSKVIGIDVNKEKLSLAKKFGATDVIDASSGDPVKAIKEITGGQGVQYSIEASGLTVTIEQAFQSVREGDGLCIFASHPENGKSISLDPHQFISGKRIEGSWGGNSIPDRDIPQFAELYRLGKLPLDRLLTKRYPLSRINQALDDLENQQCNRPLIVLNEP